MLVGRSNVGQMRSKKRAHVARNKFVIELWPRAPDANE